MEGGVGRVGVLSDGFSFRAMEKVLPERGIFFIKSSGICVA